MLEIRNLSRTYVTKGEKVKALDDVSLKFADTGMVFVLGKSGSGKSTLLNVVGGLDKYDAGEIIIDGKSSKSFKDADFDAYRNTFIGFIFQEYNILNEFTVNKNIALAMELQGKKASKEALKNMLATVDLAGLGDRKPATLSGGQKQRIAIARALIKDPQIIMADEPTGALDSNTGRQVLETLKKLSEKKLVIVVSHDREFAEKYGDRIIELADGKIIRDEEKFQAPPRPVTDDIVISDGVMTLKKGAKLTPENIRALEHALEIADEDVILSLSGKANNEIRKAVRMDAKGNMESFRGTDQSKIPSDEAKNLKLIRSRFPFKKSLRIGASSLKAKPVRLFFTILLSSISFALFGLSDSLAAYNRVDSATRTLSTLQTPFASFVKQQITHREDWDEKQDMMMSAEDIAYIKEQTGLDILPVYQSYEGLPSLASYSEGNYYLSRICGILELDKTHFDATGLQLVGDNARFPQSSNEILITKYMYDHYAKFGYYPPDSRETVKPTSESQMIGVTLHSQQTGVPLTVVGVVDTRLNAKYDTLREEKSGDDGGMIDYMLANELRTEVEFGYHGMVFGLSGLSSLMGSTDKGFHIEINYRDPMGWNDLNFYQEGIVAAGAIDPETDVLFGGRTSLARNEILVGIENVLNFQISDENSGNTVNIRSLMDESIRQEIQADAENFSDPLKQAILDQYGISYFPYDDVSGKYSFTAEGYMNLYSNQGWEYNENPFEEYYPDEIKSYMEYALELLPETLTQNNVNFDEYPLECNYQSYNGRGEGSETLKIAGVRYDINTEKSYSCAYLSDSLMNQIVAETAGGTYGFAVAPMPEGESAIRNLVKFNYEEQETDKENTVISFRLRNSAMSTLNQADDMVSSMSKVFLYVGIGFAVFAALMLFNFISTSISYKKREIGILRAIGAKKADVFGIFFNESFIISLINWLIACVFTAVACYFINRSLLSALQVDLTILIFSLRQILLVFAVSLIVALVSSFLPVWKVAKKKPVDAIRSI